MHWSYCSLALSHQYVLSEAIEFVASKILCTHWGYPELYGHENIKHLGGQALQASFIDARRLKQNGSNLQKTFFNSFSSIENCYILILISLKYVPKGPIDSKSSLVQMMGMFVAENSWNRVHADYINSCFEDYQRCIHILYNILEFVLQKKTTFTMEQPYMMPILYWQYHGCWCSGDFRSQGISRHDIEPQSWNIPPPASEELMTSQHWLR